MISNTGKTESSGGNSKPSHFNSEKVSEQTAIYMNGSPHLLIRVNPAVCIYRPIHPPRSQNNNNSSGLRAAGEVNGFDSQLTPTGHNSEGPEEVERTNTSSDKSDAYNKWMKKKDMQKKREKDKQKAKKEQLEKTELERNKIREQKLKEWNDRKERERRDALKKKKPTPKPKIELEDTHNDWCRRKDEEKRREKKEAEERAAKVEEYRKREIEERYKQLELKAAKRPVKKRANVGVDYTPTWTNPNEWVGLGLTIPE